MTITTGREPCYELRYTNGSTVDTGDCEPHFGTEDAARAPASDYGIEGWGIPEPHRRTLPCVTLPCSRCDELLGADDGGGWHFDTKQAATESAEEDGWQFTDVGWICPSCCPYYLGGPRPHVAAQFGVSDQQTALPVEPGHGTAVA